MEPARKFKIIVNSKECGTCSGPTPSAVSKKVVKKLCGTSSKAVRFSLKEIKRGCERVCGPYQGRMEKLDRPYKRDGKKITHRVVCGKVQKMRGGKLCDQFNEIVYDDFIIKKFELNQENSINQELEKIDFIKVSERCSNDTQYIFFNPIKAGYTDLIYEYVAIRIGTHNILNQLLKKRIAIFMKLDRNYTPTKIRISDIKLSILLKLYEKITNKIERNGLVAKTIYNELDEYIIQITENLSKNNINTISKLDSLFIITETNPSIIKVFSFKNNTQLIFFDIISINNNSYYNYVIIRDINKMISLKKFDENNVIDIKFSDFIKDHLNFKILNELLSNINELIKTEQVPPNFATTIRKKLESILKNKIISNSENNNRFIKYFKDTSSNHKQGDIHLYEFGSKTSMLFGDKYQFIFFNKVVIDSNTCYEYVVIRDNRKTITLKKYDGETVVDITFEEILKTKEGYFVLEKLYKDIILIRNETDRYDFATTIRDELSQYIHGDKLDEGLTQENFLIGNNDINIEKINGINYIFFWNRIHNDKLLQGNIYTKNNSPTYVYSNNQNIYNEKYYMFVVFLDKNNNINFYQLFKYKGTILIIRINENIMNKELIVKLLEYLYNEINLKYDNTMNSISNTHNKFYLVMLNSLEEYILKILNKERNLNLLRSRFFYITEKESKESKDFKILRIKKKTYIFFYRCKGKRTFSSKNIEYILYKYLIIIYDSDINFYKVNGINDKYSVFIENIDVIQVENLLDIVGRLLLGILYGHLLEYNTNDEKIKSDIRRLLNLFIIDYLSIDKYYKFIVFVNKVLTGHINKNKHIISVNGKNEQLKFNGTFDFDFLKNTQHDRNEFEKILNQLLKMKNIKKNTSNTKKYHFKPLITSIINNKQQEDIISPNQE